MTHQYTPAERHIINTGNVMLSQAGMPLMTDDQEWAFIQKQRDKQSALFGDWRLWAGVAALAAWFASRK
jgi:hypothetical protein